VNSETDFILNHIHPILYAWHLHIQDIDNDFRGYIILLMAISCIGFLWLQISDMKHTPKSVVLHQIDCGLSYFAFYMHRVEIYGILIMTFGGG
jgi:hypothetical protein